MLTARDIMTAAPRTVVPGERLLTVKKIMSRDNIRHLPVVEDGELVGIVSDRDMKLAQSVYPHRDFDTEIRVRDVCIYNPFIVEETEDLDKLLLQMARRRIGSALVVRRGELSGIITTVDICRAFARSLRDEL